MELPVWEENRLPSGDTQLNFSVLKDYVEGKMLSWKCVHFTSFFKTENLIASILLNPQAASFCLTKQVIVFTNTSPIY